MRSGITRAMGAGACAGVALVLAAGCARMHRPASAAGFNLLLITLDTVRADHIGAYGDRGAETPNLDRLASEGVRFADASSPVPLTLPAHASILSGLLPPQHGLRNNGFGRFPDTPPTLATLLAAAGYRTGAFIGAFVLDHRYGLTRGFDRYDDDIPRDKIAGLDARLPGRVVVDRALAWLNEDNGKPFFAWVHLYDAHAPYAPPEPFATRFAARPYDGGIAELDVQVGRLLDALGSRGLAARTLVAVVGDHGEELGEHGELTHGLLVYEPSLRVPLILRAPAVLAKGWVVGTPVGLADLGPTLAGLLGHTMAPGTSRTPMGRDLSQTLLRQREPAPADLYAESYYGTSFGWSPLRSVRRGDLKYIEAPRPELYDLHSDPGERDNIVARRGDQARELVAALSGLAAPAGATGASTNTLDAEARAKLLSLGYLAGASVTGESGGPPRKDPKDAAALFRTFEEAHAAFVSGRTDDARRMYEGLVAADPENPVFLGQLAELSRQAGEPGRAIELYRRAIAVAPGDRDARYNLAVTLQEAGRSQEAFEALTAAIRLDPARPEAHNALGIALALRGDLDGARGELSRAVELDPHDAQALNNLGNVLRDLKRPAEAEDAFRRAIALAPGYPDPLNGIGTLEVQRHRPAAALPYFERALALAPALQEARLNLAIAKELAGDRSGAIEAYKDFLARTAGNHEYDGQRQAAQRLLLRLERPGGSPGNRS